MSNEAYIFEVSQQSFAESVIFNSYKLPVLVEFMGVWSEPCALMDNLFSALAKEFAGQFIFAKVDIDEQEELSKQYTIKNIPTLIVFKDGKPVRTEEGQIQEMEARSLLKDFNVFRESDVMREEARNKHLTGNTSAAILLLTQAIKQDPSNIRIAMDMTQIFLDIGELTQAQSLFARLPEIEKQSDMGKALTGQLLFAELAEGTADLPSLQQRIANTPKDYQAHFELSVKYVALYNYDDAAKHLLVIIEQSPDFKDGAAKEMLIAMTNMLAPVDYEQATRFRQRLANLIAN